MNTIARQQYEAKDAGIFYFYCIKKVQSLQYVIKYKPKDYFCNVYICTVFKGESHENISRS